MGKDDIRELGMDGAAAAATVRRNATGQVQFNQTLSTNTTALTTNGTFTPNTTPQGAVFATAQTAQATGLGTDTLNVTFNTLNGGTATASGTGSPTLTTSNVFTGVPSENPVLSQTATVTSGSHTVTASFSREQRF